MSYGLGLSCPFRGRRFPPNVSIASYVASSPPRTPLLSSKPRGWKEDLTHEFGALPGPPATCPPVQQPRLGAGCAHGARGGGLVCDLTAGGGAGRRGAHARCCAPGLRAPPGSGAAHGRAPASHADLPGAGGRPSGGPEARTRPVQTEGAASPGLGPGAGQRGARGRPERAGQTGVFRDTFRRRRIGCTEPPLPAGAASGLGAPGAPASPRGDLGAGGAGSGPSLRAAPLASCCGPRGRCLFASLG